MWWRGNAPALRRGQVERERSATGDEADRGPSGRGRDVAIDRLRGLCLISMAVGHLAQANGSGSVVSELVHFPVWVSGAAGFVFLAGVSVGLLWRARGGATGEMRTWTAIRGLYLAALGIATNLVGIAWLDLIGRPAWYPQADPTVASVLTGRWWLPNTDILIVYAAFLLVVAGLAPLVVGSPRSVLVVSVALYGLSRLLPEFGPTQHPADRPMWNLAAWQVLFMAGLVGGLNWARVTATIERHGRLVLEAGAVGMGAILLLRVGLNASERGIDPLGLAAIRDGFLGTALDKQSLGPLRLVLIGLLGPAAYLLCRRRLPLDRLVSGAGSRSLRVYLASIAAVYLWPVVGVTGPWPASDIWIVALTGMVLAVGLAPALARGRPWSI